jgi:hypothetical protein
VVGWVADAVGLDRALLTTALCCVAGVLLAGFVRPRVPAARIPATTGR